MKRIVNHLLTEAKKYGKTIAFPETWDARVLRAASKLAEEGICKPVLVGEQEQIRQSAVKLGVQLHPKVGFISMQQHASENARLLYDLRSHKGMTVEESQKLAVEPIYAAVLLLKRDIVDGVVSGAAYTSAQTLRPALQIIKTAPGMKIASSYFLMIMQNKLLLYSDCSVNINPTAEELAHIAISSAASAKELGIQPKIAMLSFSTKGSGKDPLADKVIEATSIVKKLRPDLICDGEMQVDAALVPAVAKTKSPASPIQGDANVLIFPNVDAGNIAYKLTERLAKAMAIGPIVQGLAKPLNDLSRGCSDEDIVVVAAITVLQAAHGQVKLGTTHEDLLR